MNCTRRRCLELGILLAASAPSLAMVGVPGDKPLLQSMALLDGFEEGRGQVTMHILVSPGCDKAGEMWQVTRPALGRIRLRWLPTAASGGEAEVATVAAMLADRTETGIRNGLEGRPARIQPDGVDLARARRQNALVDTDVNYKLWAATGRVPATPTTVYATPEGFVRVVRGSVNATIFAQMLAEAGA